MTTKDDLVAAVNQSADASGSLELRLSLGDPAGGPLVIRGATRELGIALVPPSPVDSLLEGVADVLDARVYGRDFQQVNVAGPLATTSSTFQTACSIVTPVLTGQYRVGWGAGIQTTSGPAGEARLYDVTAAAVLDGPAVYTFAPAVWMTVGGFCYVTFAGQSKQLAVQWRGQSGVSTQTIRQAKLELWRAA